jgi:hypothetical protein
MAIAKVQSAVYNSRAGNDVTAAFVDTPTEGNLLIAFGRGPSAATNASISGWTLATSTLNTVAGWIVLFYKVAGAAESKNVTLAWTSSTDTRLIIEEWSGLSATPLDKVADLDNTGSTVTSKSSGTTDTTTVADELCIAAFSHGSTISDQSWSNSFTEEYGVAAGLMYLGSKVVSSTGAQETTLSWTTARLTGGLIATFKGVSAATNVTVDVTPVVVAASHPVASILAGFTLAASVLAGGFSIPTPTINYGATIAPAPVVGTFSPVATTIASDISIHAVELSYNAITLDPTVSGGTGLSVTPAVLSGQIAIPDPAITTELGVSITPSVLSSQISIPVPTIEAQGIITIGASVLNGALSIPAPTVNGGVTISADHLGGNLVLPSPDIQNEATISPQVLVGEFSVPSPIVGVFVSITPSAISSTLILNEPTTSAGATVSIVAVSGHLDIPLPSISADRSISTTPTVVSGNLAINEPTIQESVTTSPSVISGNIVVVDPSLGMGVTVGPSVQASNFVIPTPTITTVCNEVIIVTPVLSASLSLLEPTTWGDANHRVFNSFEIVRIFSRIYR